jgi:branched-chain amino acid transport system substrate-binding protein
MRRTLILALLALAALMGATAGTGFAQTPPNVKIALIAPMSGPWARQGLLKKMGAEMAIEEINAAGGIKALGGAKMELVIADASDSAEKAKNAAQRLVSQEPNLSGGIGSWLSTFTLAVTEVTEREHIPWLSLSYSDLITSRGFHYVFQTSPTAGRQAEEAMPTLVRLATTATGKAPTKLAIIMDNTASPVSFAKPMREGGLDRLGLKLVVDEVFTPPLADATSMVQKVRSARPDFLFLNGTAVPDDKLVLEKLLEFKLGRDRLPVVTNGAPFGTPELLRNVGKETLEGLFVIIADWTVKGQEALAERFVKRTGEPWMSQDSICTYGEVWILKEAMELAKSADKEKVNEALHTMDLKTGPAANSFPGGVRFDANGRRVGAVPLIIQWQNGVPVTVFPTEYATAKPFWPKG